MVFRTELRKLTSGGVFGAVEAPMVKISRIQSERGPSSLPDDRDSCVNGWSFRLTMPQVLILSFALSGMMLALFLVGLYAGRSQGVSYALQTYGQEAIRIPSPRAVAPANTDMNAAQITSEISDGLAHTNPSTTAVDPLSAEGGVSGDIRYDFSKSLVKESQQNTESYAKEDGSFAGFAAKPAGVRSLDTQSRARLKPETLKLAADARRQADHSAKSQGLPQNAETSKTTIAEVKKEAKVDSKNAMRNGGNITKKTSTKRSKTVINSGEENGGVARGWYVQVGAYRKKTEAGRITVRLDSHRVSSLVQDAVVRGKRFYRVLLGPYATKSEAAEAVTKLKSLKVSAGEPFIRQIK